MVEDLLVRAEALRHRMLGGQLGGGRAEGVLLEAAEEQRHARLRHQDRRLQVLLG